MMYYVIHIGLLHDRSSRKEKDGKDRERNECRGLRTTAETIERNTFGRLFTTNNGRKGSFQEMSLVARKGTKLGMSIIIGYEIPLQLHISSIFSYTYSTI